MLFDKTEKEYRLVIWTSYVKKCCISAFHNEEHCPVTRFCSCCKVRNLFGTTIRASEVKKELFLPIKKIMFLLEEQNEIC